MSVVECEVQRNGLPVPIILFKITYFFRAVLKMFLIFSDLIHYQKSEK